MSPQAFEHARDLYPQSPPQCLAWQHRLPLVVAHVRRWRPHVLCLQEVDHHDQLAHELGALG